MNTTTEIVDLRNALQRSGTDWIFRYWGANEEKHLERVRLDIGKFQREYKKRFHELPDPYALLAENPAKGAAFFQGDALQSSLEMKIMIWRILLGCEIVGIDFRFRLGEPPHFEVRLRPPYSTDEEVYLAPDPGDIRVLRNLGFVQSGHQLFFQGYFPLKGQ